VAVRLVAAAVLSGAAARAAESATRLAGEASAAPVAVERAALEVEATPPAALEPVPPAPVYDPVPATGPGRGMQDLVRDARHPWLTWPDVSRQHLNVLTAYDVSEWTPLWSKGGHPTPQAVAVLGVLANAGARGLRPTDYDAERLATEAKRLGETKSPTDGDVARFDVALTVAVMRYASDAHLGRVAPRRVGFGLDTDPKRLDLPALVAELSTSPEPAERLVALDPPFPMFRRLQTALARMKETAAKPAPPPLPGDLPKLEPGDTNPGVAALGARLAAFGYLDAPPADGTRYDGEIVEGVKRFQAQHGLAVDGVVGPATRADLRISPSERVRQIELAMERMRWLPGANSTKSLVVNIPEFRLYGFEGDAEGPTFQSAVVVGSAAQKTTTPILQADMRYVVFRPYWSVPSSIARNEIWPKQARNPGYLAGQNMEVVGGRIRQRPGGKNALGLVKFIFPNSHNVYLHDTPSKSLFGRSRRDFSHGCIRVADPVALAEFVLGWSRGDIEAAMQRGRNDRRVDLAAPVPVYLFYSTVVADRDGHVFFFDDIYGHDARLAQVLANGYPYEG
jgi:murein L,D-transpeptidase YcbB/YkuD